MRLFQNAGVYPIYLTKFGAKNRDLLSFLQRRQAYLDDRFGASHLLSPVLDGDEMAFFTNGDDPVLQEMWALENGLGKGRPLDEILLAQIEAHRTEVFYNLDPMRYGSEFVRRLPGCVRKSVCWRAAPSPGADFSAYDRVVCNFPSIIESWRRLGWRAGYLTPAHDPATDAYVGNEERPLDILFIGGYSRHHTRRARALEAVAQLASRYQVSYCLDESRVTRLADSPLGLLPGLSRHRRPPSIRQVSTAPVFGRELYQLMSRAKIVLNGAIDMAGEDRGNMRCFEALGCGALMISDHGRYPDGFVDGQTMLTYRNAEEAAVLAAQILENWGRGRGIAANGYAMVRSRYSKDVQWKMFQELLG
ncbi:MAG: glycosyltransferase [Thiobacillus sp.]